MADQIIDFSRGDYYDSFHESDGLTPEHRQGLELEIEGSRRRILDFYEPKFRLIEPLPRRVLDCGCGNGVSVDLLCDLGYEAWGNDLSQLRKWQWRDRRMRNRLIVASGGGLPFPDHYFDVVFASGVLEHIGVTETAIPRYSVRPLADRDEQRAAFVKELLRVLRPGGNLFLDFPNGAFPIDFWHGDAPGSARRHRRDEGFLPTIGELRHLLASVAPGATIATLSPFRRLQFQQARHHAHGRLLSFPVGAAFWLMQWLPFRAMTSSALNPFLVVRITA